METVLLLTLVLLPFLQTPQSFKIILPKSDWEKIYFEAINERARIAELQSLRAALPKDDVELRLWHGFGLTALEGFVLRRRGGEWSAVHLDGIYGGLPKREYQKQLSEPKSGWDAFWRRLVEMEIATLPDAEEIGCTAGVLDGMSYVVELNHDLTYRTYLYDNPKYTKCEQAKKMIHIGNFIATEFSVPEMATREE